MTATRPPAAGRRAATATLAVLCAAQFMLIVDVVVVNVALPAIRTDLHIPDSRLQLVAVAYTLTFGSLLIVFGRAGDLVGRRRLFTAGVATFTAASLGTGVATTEWLLVAARTAQGLGAAMVSPTALALLMAAFPEGDGRNRALGYWGAVGSGGAIAGQLVGGALTDVFGWRAVFLVNVPVGCLALLLARRHLEESRDVAAPRLDPAGASLLAAGLASVIVALTLVAEGSRLGGAAAAAAVAIGALAAFARRSSHHPDPLVDGRLLRTRQVLSGNLLLGLNAGMLGGSLFFTTLYLQVTLGFSPFEVGIAFAPITVIVLLASPRIGARIETTGVRRLLTIGFAMSALGMALLARLPTHGGYLRDVLPALVLIAVGSAFAYAPTFVVGTSGVAPDQHGVAAGLLNASQEIGAAVGITLLATVAASASTEPAPAGYRIALAFAALAMAVAVALVRRLEPAGSAQ